MKDVDLWLIKEEFAFELYSKIGYSCNLSIKIQYSTIYFHVK